MDHQLKSVHGLDQVTLSELLKERDHSNFAFTPNDIATLSEINIVLEPFDEATDWAQGDSATIGYVLLR